jgi:hypothetical protein
MWGIISENSSIHLDDLEASHHSNTIFTYELNYYYLLCDLLFHHTKTYSGSSGPMIPFQYYPWSTNELVNARRFKNSYPINIPGFV